MSEASDAGHNRYGEDPARHRIGLIALDSDVVTERDFHAMLPDGVVYFTTRVRHVNPISVRNLRRMGPELAGAAARLVPGQRLDVIAYSCASGTAAIGYEAVARQIRSGGRPKIPVATPISAAVAALGRCGARSVSLLTPHPDDVNQSTRRYFEAGGIRVTNIASFCLEDDSSVARVPPQAILRAAREVDCSESDALFISSTALRAGEILEAAEEALRKPVLGAVQGLFWQALRISGYREPVPGFGRLLRI